MDPITDTAALEALYGAPNPKALAKVSPRITPAYRTWIEASRFAFLATVGPEGTDASPRGDDGPVVRIVDETTLWMPDWRGNARLDSLRNIVRDGRVSLTFLVPGSTNVVRVNGTAVATADPAACDAFARKGASPRTVVVIDVAEVYFQCAKAIMRSGLWSGARPSLPSAGDFLAEARAMSEDEARAYDEGYETNAKPLMW
ncbi:MAG: pyridoxamine 5'-phosphate oxidase family protein [Paracoccaceae bacterium]